MLLQPLTYHTLSLSLSIKIFLSGTMEHKSRSELFNIWQIFSSSIPKLIKKNYNPRNTSTLTLSWRRPLSYRNQSIDLRSKSIDWFLYDNGLRHERVKREKTDNGIIIVMYFVFNLLLSSGFKEICISKCELIFASHSK